MALYADLNRKIRVLIKEGAENAEALFPAGYDFMKEEGDADLIVCASAPPEEANAPVVFWNAPRGRNDGFCLPKEENKGREKLRAYLSAAVMTKNRREDFARHAAFVCAADDASQEALLKLLSADERLAGVGVTDRQSALDGFCCRAVVLLKDESIANADVIDFCRKMREKGVPTAAVVSSEEKKEELLETLPEAVVLGDGMDLWQIDENLAELLSPHTSMPERLFDAAKMRFYGVGRPHDMAGGMALLQRAAQNKSVGAMILLSDLYRAGAGFVRDAVLCNHWMEEAAHCALEDLPCGSVAQLRAQETAAGELTRRFSDAGRRGRAAVIAAQSQQRCERFLTEHGGDKDALALAAHSALRLSETAGDFAQQARAFARYAELESMRQCGMAFSAAQADDMLCRLDEWIAQALNAQDDSVTDALCAAALLWQRAALEQNAEDEARAALAAYCDLSGELAYRRGDWDNARRMFEECVALHGACDAPDMQRLAAAKAHLAAAQEAAKDFCGACETYAAAIELWRESFEKTADPSCAAELCACLYKHARSAAAGGTADAAAYLAEAMVFCENMAQKFHLADIWESLAFCYELRAAGERPSQESVAAEEHAARLWQELYDLTYEARFDARRRQATKRAKADLAAITPPTKGQLAAAHVKKTALDAVKKTKDAGSRLAAQIREKFSKRDDAPKT